MASILDIILVNSKYKYLNRRNSDGLLLVLGRERERRDKPIRAEEEGYDIAYTVCIARTITKHYADRTAFTVFMQNTITKLSQRPVAIDIGR